MTIQPELLSLSASQLKALLPYFSLFMGTIITLLASLFRPFASKYWILLFASLTCLLSGFYSYELLDFPAVVLWNKRMVSDGYALFFYFLFLGCGFVTLLSSFHYLDREGLQYPEYSILLLFSLFGMLLMSSTQDLMVLFIALELMSLAVYVLVGFRRADPRSNEAAIKYFIFGGVASAFFLYGVALVYGMTGTTQLQELHRFLSHQQEETQPAFVLGMSLILIGFLFKVAAVPFHTWMPDVYEGAPTPITGFMTTGLKAAAFAAWIRILMIFGFESLDMLLWAVAAFTMVIGNLVALLQSQLKRLFAYSSIAHTGYLLMGILIASQSELGHAPLLLYLFVYSAANLGIFLILSLISQKGDVGLTLYHLSGLSQKNPGLSFALAVFLFSLAGIPPTAGFIGKYFLFYGSIQANLVSLVIIAVLCSALSAYYYLKVLVSLYMKDPVPETPSVQIPWSIGLVLIALIGLLFHVGCLPDFWMNWTERAIMHAL